jgi:hypothetical protein
MHNFLHIFWRLFSISSLFLPCFETMILMISIFFLSLNFNLNNSQIITRCSTEGLFELELIGIIHEGEPRRIIKIYFVKIV